MEHLGQLFQRLKDSLGLESTTRQIRLRLAELDGAFVPLHLTGHEAVCGGIDYRIACLCGDVTLSLKDLIARPAEIMLVTASSRLRRVCGLVTEARLGDFDGGLALCELVIRDAMAVMERRTNSRIFRSKNELEVAAILFDEWRRRSAVLGSAFDWELDASLQLESYPAREQIMQLNETDAAFVRRLLHRRGISWYVRPGRSAQAPSAHQEPTPAHTLVLFANAVAASDASVVRFHRADATDASDVVTAWTSVRSLQSGAVSRYSWDYKIPRSNIAGVFHEESRADQGGYGNQLAASVDDFFIEAPHTADDVADVERLGRLRLHRHNLEMKCFHGAGNVRDFCAGHVFELVEHPEIDAHPAAEREFVITEMSVAARNNLPDAILRRTRPGLDSDVPYHVTFTAVRTGVPLVPHFDPRRDLPRADLQSAIVVGPPHEEVYCDDLGRVKVRFPGLRHADHVHAQDAGTSYTAADSAWVRVMSNWAGGGPGSIEQCGSLTLPRVGTEVLVAFLGGDPDKPVILGQVYNQCGLPPALSSAGGLRGNRYLAGMRSHEVGGARGNQLRFDDTRAQISAQLASDHGASELNLGWLSNPRADGRADGRGEGAELRSDDSVAIRGAKGVLVTAEAASSNGSAHLARSGLLGLTEALQSVAEEMTRLAEVHNRDDTSAARLADLAQKLRAWEAGTNTEKGSGGGAPIVAVSAPAGIVMGSPDNVLLGSEKHVDVVSGGDAGLSTGRRILLRAARGISGFAQALGIKLVAGQGDVSIQTHHGNVEIKAAGRITLVAGEAIDLQAPDVRVVAQGAQSNWAQGNIAHQGSGQYLVKAASVDITGPGSAHLAALSFPSTSVRTDERLVLRDSQTGEPLPNIRYAVQLDNGQSFEGVTDQDGCSDLLVSNLICSGKVTFFRDDPAPTATEAS